MIEKVCPFHGIPTPEGKCMRKEFNEKTGTMEECLAVPKDSSTVYWCKKHKIPIFEKRCGCCEKEYDENGAEIDLRNIEYIGTDVRPVFPEESDIETYEKFKSDYYSDIIKEFSNSAKYFTATLLPEFEMLLEQLDLQGKDIPGVTVDTLEYLLELGECLCGTKLSEGSEAYETMMKLKKQVPPEMLGGAAGKLKSTLEAWKNDTNEMPENIKKKANDFDVAQDTLDEKIRDRDRLEKTIDRKTNLGPVRLQNKQAKERLKSLRNQKNTLELRIEQEKSNKEKKKSS